MGIDISSTKQLIADGKAVLGIELGSTRIKAILIDEESNPIASGSHEWENKFENGVWTYDLPDAWTGVQSSYASMAADVKEKYDVEIENLAALGFSGMMHGYIVFDKDENLLAPFRTWRNTNTEEASKVLFDLFNYNIPQRFSISQLYQSIMDDHDYIKDIDFHTTLSGYIHWQLTGEKNLGIGDAVGMFPIDSTTKNYNQRMLDQFDELIADKGYPWKLIDILPKVMVAGEQAGVLTEAGAKLLDVSGKLKPGIPVCPPEGDGGTGMTATNSVAVRTGNVSAGTSVFAMIVLEKELSKPYEELDMVTTPAGDAVAMIHCNNCTSDLNAWVNLFKEFAESFGMEVDMNKLYGTLYNKALEGDKDCGGLMAYNYFSGEHIMGFEAGRPMFLRTSESNFNLANFMRVHLCTSLGALRTGLDIITKQENVTVEEMLGHGGLFKTPGVGQKIMAAAVNAPVSVMETAGEGGAWGIAVLAGYMMQGEEGETLTDYLNNKVFADQKATRIEQDPEDVKGFDEFMKNFVACCPVERAAIDCLK